MKTIKGKKGPEVRVRAKPDTREQRNLDAIALGLSELLRRVQRLERLAQSR
jgi:hypothetical protein